MLGAYELSIPIPHCWSLHVVRSSALATLLLRFSSPATRTSAVCAACRPKIPTTELHVSVECPGRSWMPIVSSSVCTAAVVGAEDPKGRGAYLHCGSRMNPLHIISTICNLVFFFLFVSHLHHQHSTLRHQTNTLPLNNHFLSFTTANTCHRQQRRASSQRLWHPKTTHRPLQYPLDKCLPGH